MLSIQADYDWLVNQLIVAMDAQLVTYVRLAELSGVPFATLTSYLSGSLDDSLSIKEICSIAYALGLEVTISKRDIAEIPWG